MKKSAQKYISLVLIAALALPTSVFAQSDKTAINKSKAKQFRETLEKINEADESTYDLQADMKSLQLQQIGAAALFSGAAFLFTYNHLLNRLSREHTYGRHYDAQKFGILDWSELEILQNDGKFKQFLEIRYGEKHPELKLGLSRFKGITKVLDLTEQHFNPQISPHPTIPTVDVTVPEFFKWFLKKVDAKELSFEKEPIIQMLKALSFSKQPELYMNPETLGRLKLFVTTFGEGVTKKVLLGNLNVLHFDDETMFKLFMKQMKDPTSLAYRLYYDPNPNWIAIQESLMNHPDKKLFNIQLLQDHDYSMKKRTILVKASRQESMRPSIIKGSLAAAGLALLVGVLVYASLRYSTISALEKYNLSYESTFKIMLEDKETYNLMVDESEEFASQMADLSDYLNSSYRKKEADLKYFDDLVAKNKS